MENFIPISVLNSFPEIFEKIVHQRIISFGASKKMQSQRQHGFRPGGVYGDSRYFLDHIYKELYSDKHNAALLIAIFLSIKHEVNGDC